MLKVHKILIPALLALLLTTSCDWVKSDLSNCPTGRWLALDYSYNLQEIDGSSHLEDVTVMVYDSDGKFVKDIQSTKAERLKNGGLVALEGFDEGKYTFIVWGGMNVTKGVMQYYYVNGKSFIDSLRIGFKNPEIIQQSDFEDVYFGSLYNVTFDGLDDQYGNFRYQVDTVKLMKDSNRLACLIRYGDADTLSAASYTLSVYAPNGTMDAKNMPLQDQMVTYCPYSKETVKISENDTVIGARFGFQLLRLMKNDKSRLVLKRNSSNKAILDIPLTDYMAQLSAIYQIDGKKLSEQEYLDRQDFHTFVIYLSKEDDSLMKLTVNNWVVHNNEVHLKK